MSRKNDLEKLITEHVRRLQKLNEQKAAYGLSTEPHVLLEIENIETEIGKLKEELATLGELSHLNPYRGLAAFRETDRSLFFGREQVTAQLLDSVQQKPLVTVLGPSGSGKSSVVFAGLIPCLRDQGQWLIASLRPGDDPCGALAAALLPLLEPTRNEIDLLMLRPKMTQVLSQGKLTLSVVAHRILEKTSQANQLLLVVDQFEELYTLCTNPKCRQEFINIILQPVSCRATGADRPVSLHLVLTLRADFMGQALTCRPLADAMRDADVKLGPMMQAELQRAIETPAEIRQVSFQAGLVDRILVDVSAEPGNLPLLEFALTNLWEQQSRGELTHDTYNTIGGVKGALSGYADEVFGELSEDEQERARRVFVQMVRPGEGTENTRRLAHRDELSEADWQLVQQLAGRRLLVTDLDPNRKETAEVIHEALIQDWAQLQQWMQKDRVFRAWQERLRAAVQQWQASQQDEGALLRGVPLAEAEEWLGKREPDLSPDEQTFIRTSIELREKELAAEQARHQREVKRERALAQEQARAARRLRWLVGILASAFVLAVIVSVLVVILAGWAVIQRQEALNAKAELDRNISIGLAYAAEEALARDLDLGVLLAYEAVRLYIDNKEAVKDAQDAQEALIQAIQQSPPHYTLAGPKTGVASLAFRSDGRLVIAAQDGLVTIWDLLSKEKLQLHDWSGQEMDETEIVSVVLSPNGQQLATVDLDGTVKLWDVTLGQELSSLPDLEGEATSLTFNPDGKLLATANWDGTVKIWDVTSGKEWKPLSGLEGGATNLTFSSDGQWLAALNGWEGTVKIWDVRSRKEEVLNTLRGFEMATTNPAFSPDRTRLVTAGMDGTITVWDMTRDEAEYQILDELKGDENSTALTPEDLTTVWESACRHTSRNLTYDEWAANLGEIRNISPQTCSNRPIDLSFIVEYIRQGEKLEAMKSLIEDPATLAAITAAYPEAYIKLAGQYSEQGKYQKAANTLDQAVKQKNKPTNVELAEAYYNICVSSSYSDAEPYQPACKQAATLAPQTSDPAMNLEFCQNAVSYDLNDQAVVQAVCQQAVKLATQSADVYSLSDLCAYGPEGGLAQEEIQAVCQKAVDLATQLEDLYSLSYLCAYGPEGGPAKDIVQAACQWTLDLATQSEDLYSLSDLCTSGRDAELPEDIVGPICQRTLDLVTKLEDLDSLSYLCTFGRDAGYLDNIVEAACQRVDEIDPSS